MTSFTSRVESLRASGEPARLIELLPYAEWLGMTVDGTEAGLLFRLPPRDLHIGNPVLPALHGGVIAGFMELAAMLAVVWREAPERLPRNINFALDYLRSARPQETFARCTVNKLGGRVAQVQVDCWQDNAEAPIAMGRAHLLWDYANEASQSSSLS